MLLDRSYTSEQLHNVISRCNKLAIELGAAKYARKQELLRNVLDRIDLHDDRVVIGIDNRGLFNIARANSSVQPPHTNLMIERQAIRLRRGKALRLVMPAVSSDSCADVRDDKLIALIAESRTIMAQIIESPDKSIPTLAAELGRCRVRMMKVIKLAFLDPDIVIAIVEGRQPLKLTPGKMLASDLPLAWAEQRRVLGFVCPLPTFQQKSVFWAPETGPIFLPNELATETVLASGRILHPPKRAELRRFPLGATKVSG